MTINEDVKKEEKKRKGEEKDEKKRKRRKQKIREQNSRNTFLSVIKTWNIKRIFISLKSFSVKCSAAIRNLSTLIRCVGLFSS